MVQIIDNLLFKERHHLVLEEEDVLKVLDFICKLHRNHVPNMKVANCGWADDKKKWFIYFDTTRGKWNHLVRELNVVRVFGNRDIPENTIGIVYTTD